MQSHDPWFRGLELKYGPDGGVYISDWSDTGECHDYENTNKHDGRIFKIMYGRTSTVKVNVSTLPDEELVRLQLHKNDWYVRHARRVLQERAAAGKLAESTHKALKQILRKNSDTTRKLRALWALHVTGGLDEEQIVELLNSADERLRVWSIRLELEDRKSSQRVLTKLAELAENDPSAMVRLTLASGLQRLSIDDRWAIAAGLVSHAQDAGDAYLPLMIWYGIEPLLSTDKKQVLSLLEKSKIPLIRQFVARHIASFAE